MAALDLHPTYRGARYTLRGLYRTAATAQDKAQELEEAGMRVYAFSEPAPNHDEWFHVTARHDVTPRRRAAGIPHDRTVLWDAVRMGVQVFREVNRTARSRGAVRWYKDLDIQSLRRALQALDWNGSHLDVASRIISDIILAHPFPNANHRTSIYLARKYLESVGIDWPHYTLRGRGAKRLHRETKPFFIESKYLLQIHRHAPLVRAAMEAGYTTLLIGPDAEAPIVPQDLSLRRDALRARHRASARRMLLSQASPEQERDLHARREKTLRGWVEYVHSP